MRISVVLFALNLMVTGLCLQSCTQTSHGESHVEKIVPHNAVNAVTVQVLQEQVFNQQLISNGKLKAQQQAELYTKTSGKIVRVLAENGQWIEKGALLAELDNTAEKNTELQARQTLLKALLNKEDILLGRGYSLADSLSVPP